MHRFSKEVIDEHLNKDINISEMARILEIPMSTLSFQINAKRRWPVENWLSVLAYLGAIEIRSNGVFIKSKKISKHLKRFL